MNNSRYFLFVELIEDSVMVIVNALFLKASWRNSFKEELNKMRTFHVSENATIQTEFMEQTDIYEYLDDQNMQLEMLRLPYKGRHFSMTIVLPYANRSLDKLVESLTDQNLRKLESNLQREEIAVIIPKYKFDYSTMLNDVLIRVRHDTNKTLHWKFPLISLFSSWESPKSSPVMLHFQSFPEE